jgi:DnaJ-class molecular chaperone
MRLEGKGAEGLAGFPSGDLYVNLEVDAHPYFKRDRANIVVEASIPLSTAILGE